MKIFRYYCGCFFISVLGHDEYDDDDDRLDRKPDHIPQEGEPDFIETNCHWENCTREFESQDELVKVGLDRDLF